jgi:integrase
VAALRLDDVDLGVCTISIDPSKAGRPGLAPLSAEAREALAAWQAQRLSGWCAPAATVVMPIVSRCR